MNLGNSPPSDTPQQQEALPSYEETIETQFQKKYSLWYPQIFARTVHAVDMDTGRPAYIKRARGFSGSRSQYYIAQGPQTAAAATAAAAADGNGNGRGAVHTGEQLVWCCARERQGFELAFSREAVEEDTGDERLEDPGVPHEEEQPAEDIVEIVGMDDDVIGTTEALLDSKGGETAAADYRGASQEHDEVPPPPAYQENETGAHEQHEVRLVSTCPFPFVYDFEFPGSSQDGRLRWMRNHEEKPSAEQRQQQGPWTAFSCVERTTGRILAEVVLRSRRDSGLGTLVIHGDLDPDMHEFLVVSAIAVVEEYPVRQVSFLNQT